MRTSFGRRGVASWARTQCRSRAGIAAFAVGISVVGLVVAGADEPRDDAVSIPREEVVPARRKALVELGRRLFFDPAGSSRMGMRSCADCHDPARGYSDEATVSEDDTAATARHSQTLIDDGDDRTAHWDGAFSSIDSLVIGRLHVTFTPSGDGYYREDSSPSAGRAVVATSAEPRSVPVVDDPADDEAPLPAAVDVLPSPSPSPEGVLRDLRALFPGRDLGGPTFVNRRTAWRSQETAARRLNDYGRYAEALRTAYGTDEATTWRIAQAVAEYCRSIRSGESNYDRFAAGDADALSPAAVRGLALFRGRAGCASCHGMDGTRAPFTDRAFHDTGIAWRAQMKEGRSDDIGRRAATGRSEDLRRFKTPTLRDVARRGPYMHDGSLGTLEDVVRYYAAPRQADPLLDERFPRFLASGTDVSDLAEFLRSLTSDRRPGLAQGVWRTRAERTRLLFVDGEGDPMPGLEVSLHPAGDVLPGFSPDDREPLRLRTDSLGAVEFTPRLATHTRVALPEGFPLLGGDLVVDTARAVRLHVAVAGRVSLRVAVPDGLEPPDVLDVLHREASTFPERRLPTSVLSRAAVTQDEQGHRFARYEGPRRLDAGGAVDFLFPTTSSVQSRTSGVLTEVDAALTSR